MTIDEARREIAAMVVAAKNEQLELRKQSEAKLVRWADVIIALERIGQSLGDDYEVGRIDMGEAADD